MYCTDCILLSSSGHGVCNIIYNTVSQIFSLVFKISHLFVDIMFTGSNANKQERYIENEREIENHER